MQMRSNLSNVSHRAVIGGLGVLEMVGRKTMDILKESDGGLEVTRAIFHDRRGKPTLSDLLREGKTKSEVEDGKKEEVLQERKKSFQFWFDEYKVMRVGERMLTFVVHNRICNSVADFNSFVGVVFMSYVPVLFSG